MKFIRDNPGLRKATEILGCNESPQPGYRSEGCFGIAVYLSIYMSIHLYVYLYEMITNTNTNTHANANGDADTDTKY